MNVHELDARRRQHADDALKRYDFGDDIVVSDVEYWKTDGEDHWYCLLELASLDTGGERCEKSTLHVRFASADSAEIVDTYCLMCPTRE
jgi:hypothetical protein